MTMAVCVKCGCLKVGAFTDCPECGFQPNTDEELAESLALTDWFYEHRHLKKLAATITEEYREKQDKGDSVD